MSLFMVDKCNMLFPSGSYALISAPWSRRAYKIEEYFF